MDRRIIPLQRAIEQTKRRNSEEIYTERQIPSTQKGYAETERMINEVFYSPPELINISNMQIANISDK